MLVETIVNYLKIKFPTLIFENLGGITFINDACNICYGAFLDDYFVARFNTSLLYNDPEFLNKIKTSLKEYIKNGLGK